MEKAYLYGQTEDINTKDSMYKTFVQAKAGITWTSTNISKGHGKVVDSLHKKQLND